MSLELRHLRHAIALAEHGSFARAAVALRLSQPALSRSIQSLERQVGSDLFVRSSSGVVPTDHGRVFVERARRIARMADDLDRDTSSSSSLRGGHVTIGAGPYPVESILVRALSRFLAEQPRVRVRVQLGNWDELLRRLRSRELDLFVAEISTLSHDHDLAIEPMTEHPLYLAARAGHPLGRRSGLGVADVLDYPLVAMSRIPPRVLEPMLAAQASAHRRRVNRRAFPALECNSLSAALRIVSGSDAILPTLLSPIRAKLEREQMTLLASEPWLSVRYGLVCLEGQPLGPAAAELRRLVIEAEHATSLEEQRLAARWKPGRARSRRPVPRAPGSPASPPVRSR